MANVFIIIVTFNGKHWIRDLLKSVRMFAEQSTTIIVDNASTDGTQAIVKDEYPEVTLIPLDNNIGFGRGNNIGISEALRRGADYVFLLNQDAFLVEDCVAKLKEFLDVNSGFDIVTPLHCSPTATQIDKRTFYNYLAPHAYEYLSDACQGSIKSHYQIKGINAAAWFVRASLFSRLGGFDPLFFMYCEDDDLIERYAYHGVKFALLPSALIVHLRQSPKPPKSTWLQSLDKLASRSRSRLILRIKSPARSVFYILSYILVKQTVQPLVTLLWDRRFDALLASYIGLLKTIPDFPKIFASRRLVRSFGPHFLNISDKKKPKSQQEQRPLKRKT